MISPHSHALCSGGKGLHHGPVLLLSRNTRCTVAETYFNKHAPATTRALQIAAEPRASHGMSSSDWRRWCADSQRGDLQLYLFALDGWSCTAIAVYAVAALVGVFFWLRWFQLTSAQKALIWPGFKWFTALVAIGCVFGCLSIVCFRGAMQYLYQMYDADVFSGGGGDKAQASEYFGYLCRWWSAQIVLHVCELTFIASTDLQILDYMLDKLMEAESLAAKRLLLKKLLRVTQFTMLLLSLVCVGIMSAACAYNVLASNLFFKSAAEYRAGDSVLGSRVYDNAIDVNDRADNFQGISDIIEAVISLSIVTVFMVFGAYAWRMVSRAQQLLQLLSLQLQENDVRNISIADSAMSKGRRLQKRVEGIIAVVFISFVFRAIFMCLYAYTYVGVDRRPECGLCGQCQSDATIMHVWFDYNPQALLLIRMICSPVALVLVLSAMIGQREKELLFVKLR